MTADIVITGLGTLGPHGIGLDPLRNGLSEGRPATSPIELSPCFHRAGSARMAGRVDPLGLKPYLDPQLARRLSLPSRMAVAAARMALADAGLERAELAGRDVAVSLGTAFGPNEFTVRLLDQIRHPGPESASPFLFMESVANAHAGQVALDSRLRGTNATVVQREASALLAVAQGMVCLASEHCELALVGCVDEVTPLTHGMLDRFGALSRGKTWDSECGRAFDAEREGIVYSEGATVLVLERAARARARGAPIRARLRAAIRANDPSASASNWGSGHVHLASALRRGLKRAGIAPIDRIISGASGSRHGDRLEGLHLCDLFGSHDLPPILAPKACTGEFGGGFLAAAVLALSPLDFGPTPGFERVDPELGIRPHDGRRLPPPHSVLVSSLAAGGAAAWIVLASA